MFDSDGRPTAVAVDGGLHSNDDHTLRQAAIDGCGIVRMPGLFLRDAIARGELEQLWPNHLAPPLMLVVVYPFRRELPGKVRAFVDFLVECREEWR
ncbi:MAG: LysR substrate-binding domain-containing protein [Wenzhouxiangellaceae bacterium]|nr:LysR substrate-binding domain-containing protein [Wenzhouxiangellaceae bacterium]